MWAPASTTPSSSTGRTTVAAATIIKRIQPRRARRFVAGPSGGGLGSGAGGGAGGGVADVWGSAIGSSS
jgi:hypothetical protein